MRFFNAMLVVLFAVCAGSHATLAYYNPATGRFLNRDPIAEPGAIMLRDVATRVTQSSYRQPFLRRDPSRGDIGVSVFVKNSPTGSIDALGLQAVNCAGTCGAIADDWFKVEVEKQLDGWAKYSQANPATTLIGNAAPIGAWGYIHWANGNQRYKDSSQFAFSAGTNCGRKGPGDDPNAPGCGFSVTLCGKCVKSAVLGNIMYGLVAAAAGFDENGLVKDTDNYKGRAPGMTVDPHDGAAYRLGHQWYGYLASIQNFTGGGLDMGPTCDVFRTIASNYALEEGRKGGGHNSAASCRLCTEKTKETRHGGSAAPRLTP